ncbi:Putative CAMK/CAMKL protein kinase [Rhizopus microsporus]|nr:Putative CAMK/CAMKL protein kinase [Rhizopus microsporus]
MTAVDTIPSPSPQRRIIFKKQSSPMMSPGNRRRKDVGDYWLGKTLGKGSSGCVKIGIHKVTGEKVAIKIISKSHLAANASVEKAVKREIAVMKLIKHPNIMSLLDVIDLSDSPNLYLILEYVQGGELFEYLVSRGRLSEKEARKYFQQIIIGLDYCHRHLICHRDLKPENLLLDRDKNIKIADFGMASLQPTGSLLETSCGSPHYASPEIVNGVPYDGSASDIWSCGIILYALLSGHLPFDDDNIRQLLNKVKMGKYKIPDHVSDEAKDLIQRILVINPSKRLTMKQVQSHPWFTADPPPNPTTLPDPPTAAEIGRPVSHVSEIDDRILETLKVLWAELSTDKIVEALLNSEYNMQKVTYVLLQRHANSYWQIDRDDEIRSVASPAKRRRRPITICAFSNSKDSFPGLKGMMTKLAQEKLVPPMSPGIQHHSTPSQSRPTSHTSLRPVISETDNVSAVNSASSHVSATTTTTTTLAPPPPVPPKPTVIRTDRVYEDYQQKSPWQFAPNSSSNSNQLHTSNIGQSPVISRPSHFYTTPRTAPYSPGHENPSYSQQIPIAQQPYVQAYFHPQLQQHMNNISHMLSPRVPSHHRRHNNDPEDSQMSRMMHLWQRNKVDPASPLQRHQYVFDRTAIESSSLVWKDPSQAAPFLSPAFDVTPTSSPTTHRHAHRYSFNPPCHYVKPQQHTSPTVATSNNSKRTSWLPGLFHFKQPKVCSLECEARDEREAIGKLSQVLRERMDGFITERQEPDGRIRRKGEMRLMNNTKTIFLKFKLEIYQLLAAKKRGLYRISFIQQQGKVSYILT